MSIDNHLNVKHLLPIAAILLGLVGHYSSTALEFVSFDDPLVVYENPIVLKGVTLEGVQWAFTTGHHANWHPLTWVSLMLDSHCFGNGPVGFHRTNLVLHLLSIGLVYSIIMQLVGTKCAALVGSSIFAVHPLCVQTVAWVGERKGSLSGMLFFLTIVLYLRYARHPSVWRMAIVLAAFLASLLSKQMAVTLPLLLLALDVWPLRRLVSEGRWIQVINEKMLFFVIACVFIGIAFAAQASGDAIGNAKQYPLFERVLTAISAPGFYLRKFLVPIDLSFHYHNYGGWPKPIDLGLSILFFFAMIRCASTRAFPLFLMGGLWFLITIAPVSGLIQIGKHQYADRYAYAAIVGLIIPISVTVQAMIYRFPRYGIPTACALLIFLTLRTSVEVQYWRDSKSLYSRALELDPWNPISLVNLGEVLRREGDFNGAREMFDRVIENDPKNGHALNGRGVLYNSLGHHAKALVDFQSALEVNAEYADARMNEAYCWVKLGALAEAEAIYRKLLDENQDNSDVLQNLGGVMVRQGKLSEAIECYKDILRLYPEISQANLLLAETLAKSSQWQEAVKHYTIFLALSPDSIHANVGLCRCLANAGRGKAAVDALRGPLSRQPANIDLLTTLAWLMVHLEDEAVDEQTRQLSIRLSNAMPPKIPWVLCAWCDVMFEYSHNVALANGLKLLPPADFPSIDPSLDEEIERLHSRIDSPITQVERRK